MSTATQEFDFSPEMEEPELEDSSEVLEISVGEETMDGAKQMADELDRTADGFEVSGFKCVGCGLSHGHDTDKHRSSDSFNMSHEEAGNMEANSVCHCGVNAIGYGDDGPDRVNRSEARSVADNAPIPPSAEERIKN